MHYRMRAAQLGSMVQCLLFTYITREPRMVLHMNIQSRVHEYELLRGERRNVASAFRLTYIVCYT